MNDPKSQAGKVANGMLNPVTVAEFTERYWTDDCQLVHPQMWLKGHKAVYMAYKLWGLLNRGKASWETSELSLDDTGNLVMMHGDTLCYLYGIPHFRLNWYITLTLEDGPDGNKLIKQQHDHLLAAETFVYQLPLVGKWFEMVIPRMGATAGLFFMQASGTVLNALGYKTEVGDISKNGVNYLDLTEAWHKGTTDMVAPPEKKVYQKHTPNR